MRGDRVEELGTHEDGLGQHCLESHEVGVNERQLQSITRIHPPTVDDSVSRSPGYFRGIERNAGDGGMGGSRRELDLVFANGHALERAGGYIKVRNGGGDRT